MSSFLVRAALVRLLCCMGVRVAHFARLRIGGPPVGRHKRRRNLRGRVREFLAVSCWRLAREWARGKRRPVELVGVNELGVWFDYRGEQSTHLTTWKEVWRDLRRRKR